MPLSSLPEPPLTVPGGVPFTEGEIDINGFGGLSPTISTTDGSATITGAASWTNGTIGTATQPPSRLFTEFNLTDPSAPTNHAFAQPGISGGCQPSSVICEQPMSQKPASSVDFDLEALGGLASGSDVTSTSSTFAVTREPDVIPGPTLASVGPILPSQCSQLNGACEWFISGWFAYGGILFFFDPPITTGYTFTVTDGGVPFQSVLLPVIGNSDYILHFFDGSPDVALAADTQYFFSKPETNTNALNNVTNNGGFGYTGHIAFVEGCRHEASESICGGSCRRAINESGVWR